MPELSSIVEYNPRHVVARCNEFGNAVRRSFDYFNVSHKGIVSIVKNVVMPDHIHFIIFVKVQTEKKLGDYIGALLGMFKSNMEVFKERGVIGKDQHVFKKGYNDRILLYDGQLKRMNRYIADNPRRRLYRRRHPDLFRERFYFEFNGEVYTTVGNINLLLDIDRQQVMVRSAWSDVKRSEKIDAWMRCASQGGVLASPFISRTEKMVMRNAMEIDGKIIYITDKAMGKRDNPQGVWGDYCANGNLLMIAPYRDKPGKLTAEDCARMNNLASYLASSESDRIRLRRIF